MEIENSNLRYIFNFLKPGINIPFGDTIKNNIMKTFNDEKIRLKEVLQVY